MSTTENPTPSAQDDIKSVLQDTLIEQVSTLLSFTSTDTLQLQIPETETYIFAGPLHRIAELIWREIAEPAASFGASSVITPEYKAAQKGKNAAASCALAALASQSQAAQPTGDQAGKRSDFEDWMRKYEPRTSINRLPSGDYESGAVESWWRTLQFVEKAGDSVSVVAYSCAKRAAAGPDAWSQTCEEHCGDGARCPAAHLAGQSQATKAQAEPVAWAAKNAAGWDFTSESRAMTNDHINDALSTEEGRALGPWELVPLYAAPVAKEAPAVPEGWKLVPVEPTEAMRYAYEREAAVGRIDVPAYRAMLAAAPQAPVAKEVTQQAAKAETAEQALRKLCDQLDNEKRRMRHTPGTGQNHSHLLAEDVDAYVEEARKVLAPTASQQGKQANVMTPFAAPASQHDAEPWVLEAVLAAYLLREMPSGTVIGNPVWWAARIASAVEAELPGRFRAKGGITNADSSDVAPTTSIVSAPNVPTYDLGEDRIDNALANFLAEHTNLSQDGIDTHAITMAWAINHAALKPVDASDIAEWCEQGYLTTPGSIEGTQAAPEEVRNQALEEAAKVAEDTDVATFTHAQVLHDDGSQTRSDIAAAIRALRTSTDQADTDTGSPA